MSDLHDPTPSPKDVRDLYANGADPTAITAKYRDQIADLSDHFKSYRSLERMVAQEYVDPRDDGVRSARAEISALLRALNSQMERQLDKMAQTALALQIEAGKAWPKT